MHSGHSRGEAQLSQMCYTESYNTVGKAPYLHISKRIEGREKQERTF